MRIEGVSSKRLVPARRFALGEPGGLSPWTDPQGQAQRLAYPGAGIIAVGTADRPLPAGYGHRAGGDKKSGRRMSPARWRSRAGAYLLFFDSLFSSLFFGLSAVTGGASLPDLRSASSGRISSLG